MLLTVRNVFRTICFLMGLGLIIYYALALNFPEFRESAPEEESLTLINGKVETYLFEGRFDDTIKFKIVNQDYWFLYDSRGKIGQKGKSLIQSNQPIYVLADLNDRRAPFLSDFDFYPIYELGSNGMAIHSYELKSKSISESYRGLLFGGLFLLAVLFYDVFRAGSKT